MVSIEKSVDQRPDTASLRFSKSWVCKGSRNSLVASSSGQQDEIYVHSSLRVDGESSRQVPFDSCGDLLSVNSAITDPCLACVPGSCRIHPYICDRPAHVCTPRAFDDLLLCNWRLWVKTACLTAQLVEAVLTRICRAVRRKANFAT